MAEIKTKPTAASVEDFINTVKDEQKRKDSFVILGEIMKNRLIGKLGPTCFALVVMLVAGMSGAFQAHAQGGPCVWFNNIFYPVGNPFSAAIQNPMHALFINANSNPNPWGINTAPRSRPAPLQGPTGIY